MGLDFAVFGLVDYWSGDLVLIMMFFRLGVIDVGDSMP